MLCLAVDRRANRSIPASRLARRRAIRLTAGGSARSHTPGSR